MRELIGVLVVLLLLLALSLPAAAAGSGSTDPGYNFAAVRTVLVMTPALTFNGFDVSGQNRFVTYPDAAAKVAALLNGKLKKETNLRYVTMDYVTERVKADSSRECDADTPEFAALVKREMPKYVDLVLYLTVRDMGWFYEYREAYESWETVTDRVRYRGKTPDGKDFDGWMDVERQVLVYHPPHYEIIDSAGGNFGLVDIRTGKYVWTYNDYRTRSSPAAGGDYDHTGPESMLNRIFDEAMDRMPIYPRPPATSLMYN